MLLGQRLLPLEVRQVYREFDQRKPRRGLSEQLVRKHYEKRGWVVWRGGLLNADRDPDTYPNVRKKYAQLMELLRKFRPGAIDELRYLCHIHHGMPDFLCYKDGRFVFIECKLGYEQLSKWQKLCIARLKAMGFPVEIHRLAEPQTKTRTAMVNLRNGRKQVLEKQLPITL